MKITDIAVQKIRKENKAIARLMILFDRGQKSIERWMEDKDIRLTLPEAVLIISEETRLTPEEILEPSPGDSVAA